MTASDCRLQAPLLIINAGEVEYTRAERIQQELVARRRAGEIPDLLLLVEHPPVVTVGRSLGGLSGAVDVAGLAARGVPVHEVARGGEATWHGPGQLVGYPILDLRALRCDLHWYLRSLEETLIEALATLGYQAGRRPGHTGVWVAGRKVASIGVAVRGWVTWHGFALNVACPASAWGDLSPCGLPPEVMASLADLPGPDVTLDEAREAISEALCRVFCRNSVPAASVELLPPGVF